MRARLCLCWLATLIVAHLVLRVMSLNLGPAPGDGFLAYFFGINLPTMVLGAGLKRNSGQGFLSLLFMGGMALILFNFMTLPSTVMNMKEMQGLLCLLTAQSLWLAYPVYWIASHQKPTY